MNQLQNRLMGPLRSWEPEAASDEINILDLLRTLWRGKFWILLSVVIFSFAGWYYGAHVAVPKYKAIATVVLEPKQSNISNLEGVVSGISGDQMTINTEVEVLTSHKMMGLLVDRLSLTQDPEFNPYLADSSNIPPSETQREVTIGRVSAALSVANIRSSYVFQITAVTTDARKSVDLVNTLADTYVADQLQVKFDATTLATDWLADRVAELKTELEESETALQAFSGRIELISPEALEALSRQIKDTRSRLESLAETRDRQGDRLDTLRQAIATQDFATIVTAGNDTVLTELTSSGTQRDRALARAEEVAGRLDDGLQRTNAQVMSLSASVNELQARYDSQSADAVALEQMKREIEATRALYEYFLARMKETAVQQGIQQADSRVLSYSSLPTSPSEPRKARILGLAMILGLMIGASAILLREMLHTGFRTAAELEQRTGHAVLGQIPRITARRRKNVLKYLVEKPTSAAVEAVRNLRTSLLLSNVDSPPKIILSTSAMPGEGKTTVAIALAMNFAGMGKRVLLMEGDIRRRVFSEYFKLEQNAGLLSVLSGEKSFEAAVQHADMIGVDILLGGRSSTNAADLFSSDRFAQLMGGLRRRYDVVIIDMPPVLLVPDTKIVAQMADAVLFSVKWDYTSRAQVEEAIRQFDVSKTRIAGLVLTQIDPKGMSKYGYGGKYGAYGGYDSKYYSS